ncbi:MAG TPA: RQC domain-containing protein, partial [Pirellulales bacterium]
AYPSREVVAQVHRFLCGLDTNPIELTQQEVKEALNLQIGAEAIGTCEKLLESAGMLERLEAAENTAAVRLNSDLPTLVDLLPQQAKIKRQVLRAVEQWVGSQRNEWCYLQPRELLTRLPGYTLADLGRHLRELASLSAFDYVPPFRGRAIHVRDRARRFDDLKIDFDSLDQRKNSEYEKLERVLRFARHRGCREQEILNYFGQHDSEACGRCDNCAKSGPAARSGAASSPTSAGLVDAVRMVLSGVARVSRSRSGCGKQLLAQMLCGSAAKGVTRNRLDKLSTFGLLAHARQTDVAQLIDALLICGLLEQTELEPFRPVLALTDRGSEIMNGGRDLLPTLPIDEHVARRLVPPQQRGSKAAKPAATVEQVSDAASRPPQSQQSSGSVANQVPNVAPVVEPAHAEASVDEVATQPPVEQPTHYWTWRLLTSGFTPGECAAVRALEPEVVLDHALRAADAGLPIQASWFLSEEQIRQIDAVIGSPGVARIRPLLERLPRGTRYEAVQLVLKARGQTCPA